MTPFFRQAWAVSGVLINMLAQGMVLSYPTSLLPALQAPDAVIKADFDTSSWLASSVGLAGIPGFLLSSILMERYGRKLTHAQVILPACIGWSLIYFAKDVPTIMIGRILTGFTSGGTVALGAVVIGEYTSPKNRGMFLNLKTSSVSLGGMLVHILSRFLSWRAIALAALVPNIGSLMIILTWPESPGWLAAKGEFERSKKSFFWLRGKDDESSKELEEMIQAQVDRVSRTKDMAWKEKTVEFFKKFTRKDFLKPLFIICLGAVLIEVSGRHLFPAYALDIMAEITGSKNQSFYLTLALDLIITISSTCSSALVRMVKRRTLLFSTGFASVAILATVCTYLLLASRDVISKERSWIPIGLFIAFFILVNLGCTPIPLAFLGELLPLAHRGAGSGLAGVVLSLNVNLGLQLTPLLLANFKVYGTFAVLGTSMAVVLTMLYFILPETKDRTLQEIENYFNYGRFKEDVVKSDDVEVETKMIVSQVLKQ
ncbi:facilitated trehalose transporter Tret1-like [Pectinophora gossypiella]|uniref:facilitated trehalose transporter Tret1-like n=1 Tax=Pectinophora gossypiella TaxID=13191 RepID=UPI00214E7386|nr:facilitated trehalose transporter Tret1-like [Pectinophora gossypiella]